MATTSIYGLRYRESTDTPDIAAGTQNLAEDVESELQRIDGSLTARGFVAESVRTTSVGPFTTAETVVQSVTFTAVAGARYKVSAVQGYSSSVVNDIVQLWLRYNTGSSLSTSGTQITTHSPNVDAAGRTATDVLIGTFVAASSGTLTVGVTAKRNTGTGNVTMFAASTQENTVLVERI